MSGRLACQTRNKQRWITWIVYVRDTSSDLVETCWDAAVRLRRYKLLSRNRALESDAPSLLLSAIPLKPLLRALRDLSIRFILPHYVFPRPSAMGPVRQNDVQPFRVSSLARGSRD